MGFRGKQILVLMTVATVVALTTSLVNALLLTRTEVDAAHEQAVVMTQTLFLLSSRALKAAGPGADPREVLANDPALRNYAAAVIGYSRITFYLAIVDNQGIAVFHNNPGQIGEHLAQGYSLDELRQLPATTQVVRLWTVRRLTNDLTFSVYDDKTFGSARVSVSPVLLRARVLDGLVFNVALIVALVLVALLASFYFANRLLRPIEVLRRELKRIDVGDEEPLDLRTERDVERVAAFFASIGERLGERKEASADAEARLHDLSDRLAEAMVALDRHGRILALNPRAAELFRTNGAPVAGRSLTDVAPRCAAPLLEVAREAESDGHAESRSIGLDIDGESVRHLVRAERLGPEPGDGGTVLTLRDLDRTSELGEQLSHSQKLATLGRLGSGVAHEIKNPLQAMVLNLDLLRQDLADGRPAERRLDVLDREIRRLNRVVLGFLEFARPDELDLDAVHLERLTRDVLERLAPRAEDRGVQIDKQIEPGLPVVLGSADLLHQALLNLMNNACDAMENGGRLRVVVRRAPDRMLAIDVEDTGTGIPEDVLPRLFELYFTTKTDGSGIGLAIVYRIVDLHGGRIEVKSQPGEGTRFTVILPEARA